MRYFLIVMVILITGCARTSTMPLSRNVVQVTVNAAPVCGTAGAQRVALRVAAAETVNRGFERFIIGGAEQSSELIVAGGGTSNTRVTFIGNTAYATTTSSPPIFMHRRNQVINVVMLNRGDIGFENGLDAKQTLGSDWQKKLDTSGLTTCAE